MKYSETALQVLAAKECGIIKSNAQFWGSFEDKEKFEEAIANNDRVKRTFEKVLSEFDLSEREEGILCAYDDDFPVINRKVKNNGEKPYLLFYRGDLSLLKDLNKNVAVIGLLDPDEEIKKRESEVVKRLIENELVIVSGLAIGCDTIAHKVCVESGGRTIAILPTQISKIFPTNNRLLAEEIVLGGGLLISEYYKDSASKREAINRFIERDRLQAMFAKAVILIASYRKNEGDSGSRYAMEAAKKYEIERYVMYNAQTDESNGRFGLNKDLADVDKVKILISNSINCIKSLENSNLTNSSPVKNEQLTLFDR